MGGTSGLDGPTTARAARSGPRPDARRSRRATPPARPTTQPATTGRRGAPKVVLSALVMAFAAALVATIALPSYAVNPAHREQIQGRTVTPKGQQTFSAASGVVNAELSRDGFQATSSATLLRRQFAQQFASYSGPSAADYLKNPAHPSFSLDAVFNTAQQYIGVPYVFGGADPSGFDCSGFVMFVYAQYGINLPHSVHLQDAIGTPISEADAQPGDVVVFNNGDYHDGFYAGNGYILHAPYPGARVRIQKLWTTDVHFIRFGI